MPRTQLTITLVDKTLLAHNTVELGFVIEDDMLFEFQAGQFVQVLFNHEDREYKRSYSIANSPESFLNTGKIQIAISFVDGGTASAFFQGVAVGEKLQMLGPFGVLTLPDTLEGNLLLTATGTGIAPYRSMIPSLENLASPNSKVYILMGGRYRNEIIYQQDFQQLTDNNTSIEYRICLSRESTKLLQKGEYEGYVQQQLNQLNLDPSKDIAYLCGNPSMVDDTAALLKQMLFESKKIKREKYVYSGH